MFGKLFSRKKSELAACTKSVDEMSYEELLLHAREHLREIAETRTLIQFYRRFFEIAWFDHHVVPEHRKGAADTASAIAEDIRQSLQSEPEALASFEEASDNHADQIPFYGFGSLQWIIDEHEVEATELVRFAVQPEFTDLLPTYLTMLSTNILNEVRVAFLKELICARRVDDHSDLEVVRSLITHGDRAIDILTKPDEFRLLRDDSNSDVPEAIVWAWMNA